MTSNLVTGGMGFVGRALVAALRSRGEFVRILDLDPRAAKDGVVGSITDPAAAAAAVEGADCVFHLAGDAQLWRKDASVFDRVNHQGTRVMLDAARRAKIRRFVHCSSLTTLVGVRTPIGASDADETVRLDPAEMLGPYPRSKRRAEVAVEAAASDGLDALIALPTEPLGPGDDSLTPPTRLIIDLLSGKTPATIDCILNFTPVASLAEGLIAARDHGKRGERYLLGGENVTMRSLLAALRPYATRPLPTLELPYWVALGAGLVDTHLVAALSGAAPKAPLTGVRLAGRRVRFSSAKAARELGWTAAPFEPALKDAVSFLRSNGRIDRTG